MKIVAHLSSILLLATASAALSAGLPIPEKVAQEAFGERKGSLVMIDCSTGASSIFSPKAASEELPPCSTFKIWNTLIGLENGVIHSADEAFYKWDGETRFIPDWNQDLTLKEAFQVSCVPAFQDLARKIGATRMQSAIDEIGYGNRDLSAGVDVFWLPAPGRKTILISPEAQARLITKLVSNELPFSKESLATLKEVMRIKQTDRGVLYGKTGSMGDGSGKYVLGWFVGYVEHNGQTHAFAAVINAENSSGRDARTLVETVLEKQGFL